MRASTVHTQRIYIFICDGPCSHSRSTLAHMHVIHIRPAKCLFVHFCSKVLLKHNFLGTSSKYALSNVVHFRTVWFRARFWRAVVDTLSLRLLTFFFSSSLRFYSSFISHRFPLFRFGFCFDVQCSMFNFISTVFFVHFSKWRAASAFCVKLFYRSFFSLCLNALANRETISYYTRNSQREYSTTRFFGRTNALPPTDDDEATLNCSRIIYFMKFIPSLHILSYSLLNGLLLMMCSLLPSNNVCLWHSEPQRVLLRVHHIFRMAERESANAANSKERQTLAMPWQIQRGKKSI